MKKGVAILFVLIILSSMIFISADQVLEPIAIEETVEIQDDYTPPPEAQERMQRQNVFEIFIWIIAILSAISTIFIAKFMVKKNPKKINLVLHSLIFLGTLILSIIFTIQFSASPIFMILPSYIGLVSSGLILWKGGKYARNLSISVVFGYLIFSVISIIFESIYGIVYDISIILSIIILTIIVALPLYVILGIVGAVIDRVKNK